MGWSSVRIRLTLWNGAIVAVLMIAFGHVLCLRVQQELSGSIDAGLAAAADPLRVAPPFFPPPISDPEGRTPTGGPVPAPAPGFVFGAVSGKRPPGVPAGAGLAPGPGTPPGGSVGVTFGAMPDEPGPPPFGGIMVTGTGGLADDDLTPLPRFFALTGGPTGGPVSDAGPAGPPEAWDPAART